MALSGFSTSRTTFPSLSSATPYCSGSGTGVSRIIASGRSSRNAVTRSPIPPWSRLSPRYITNGDSPRNGSAVSTAWASPSGASCGMYVIRTPNFDPSPAASRISSPVSGAMMIPISSIPASAIASMP